MFFQCSTTNISEAAAVSGYTVLDSGSVHVPHLCLSSGVVSSMGSAEVPHRWCVAHGGKVGHAAAQQSGTPAASSLHAISVW